MNTLKAYKIFQKPKVDYCDVVFITATMAVYFS